MWARKVQTIMEKQEPVPEHLELNLKWQSSVCVQSCVRLDIQGFQCEISLTEPQNGGSW